MNFTHDDQYLRDLLIHVVEEDAEDCPHPLSASAPRETGEEPPLPEEETLPREETPPVPEEKSPPQDTPTPPRGGGSLSEEEVMELAWQVSRMRLDTQREIRQLTALLEEQTRKGADSAARNRREGRRCRSYGFIAGAALVMAAMPVLTAAMTLSWKALGWFAQVMEVSPAALCASLFCVLLGIGTLKATKPLGDRISEWLEEEEYDDKEV